MLCYLGKGPRRYAEKPIKIYGRPYWEFQAVVSGRIALCLPDQTNQLRRNHLWLSAPGHPHGWTGEPGKPAEVAVFHFLTVPDCLARKLAERGILELSLSDSQRQRIKWLSKNLEKSLHHPGPEMVLRHEHALLELSLLVFEEGCLPSTQMDDAGGRRVQRAMDWFAANLSSNPGLEEVARAAGVSTSQLRRHFYEIMRSSPKKIFDQLRFQTALQLMADPEIKLSTVSEDCGFESPSAFSRAFKIKFGVSPDHWRGPTTTSRIE